MPRVEQTGAWGRVALAVGVLVGLAGLSMVCRMLPPHPARPIVVHVEPLGGHWSPTTNQGDTR